MFWLDASRGMVKDGKWGALGATQDSTKTCYNNWNSHVQMRGRAPAGPAHKIISASQANVGGERNPKVGNAELEFSALMR